MSGTESKPKRFQFRLADLMTCVALAALGSLLFRNAGLGGVGIVLGLFLAAQVAYARSWSLTWILLASFCGMLLGAMVGLTIEFALGLPGRY